MLIACTKHAWSGITFSVADQGDELLERSSRVGTTEWTLITCQSYGWFCWCLWCFINFLHTAQIIPPTTRFYIWLKRKDHISFILFFWTAMKVWWLCQKLICSNNQEMFNSAPCTWYLVSIYTFNQNVTSDSCKILQASDFLHGQW